MLSAAELGDHVVTLTVTDHTGLISACTATVTVQSTDADGDGVRDSGDPALRPGQRQRRRRRLRRRRPCPNDPDNDIDGDGFCGDVDNLPSMQPQPIRPRCRRHRRCHDRWYIGEVLPICRTTSKTSGLQLKRGAGGGDRRLGLAVSRFCNFSSPGPAISS